MSRTVRMLVGLAFLGTLIASVAPTVHSMAAEARDGGKGGGAEPDIAFLEPNESDSSRGSGSISTRTLDRSRLHNGGADRLSFRRWVESVGRRVMDALHQTRRVNEAAQLNGAKR